MPLPERDMLWPPPALKPILDDVATHAAWYSGDRTRLATIYGRDRLQGQLVRPSERQWFWSRDRNPQEPGKRDSRVHIPLAADIATTSADLLFSEPPTFTVDDKDTQDRLDELVDNGGIVSRLIEAAEVGAALGGVYLKVNWNLDVAQHPVLTAVHVDSAVPDWQLGFLTGVTFWRELARNGTGVLRFLERHEPGAILYGLYEGSTTNLGRATALTEHPETAGLVEGLIDGNRQDTGATGLTAVYVPNMSPNRKWRGSDQGRSDYQGVEDLFDALDETWTSWMRDLRLGRGRLVVPDSYLQSEGKGRGASFDADREVYAGLQMPPTGSNGAASLTVTQFAIRVDEHARTAQELVARAVAVAGYSGQTFGLAGDVAATATEVTARERKSFITRDKKVRYWTPELGGLLETLLQVDVALGLSRVTPERPRVSFGDGVSEDPTQVATTLQLLAQATAISTQTKVERLHPDWDEPAVAAEVDRIHAETGQAVPMPEPSLSLPA